MQGTSSGTPADVVAVFDTQGAAEEGVYRLRLAGFGDDRIACYSRAPGIGLLDTFNRDFAFAGAAIGGAIGATIGKLLAPLVNQLAMSGRNIDDAFGLSALLLIIPALACGLIGWGIGLRILRPAVAEPSAATAAGPFVLAVTAGGDRERAWTAIRAAGGREPSATGAAHH